MRKDEATRKHDANEKDKIRCLHSQSAIKIGIHIVYIHIVIYMYIRECLMPHADG